MEFLGALRSFLTRDHYASGKSLHLLSEFVFVIPDVPVKEGVVVPQHGIQVMTSDKHASDESQIMQATPPGFEPAKATTKIADYTACANGNIL